MQENKNNSYLNFQKRWDKTIFYGSIMGSIIALCLTFIRYNKCTTLAKENQQLKKENVELQQRLKELEIKK